MRDIAPASPFNGPCRNTKNRSRCYLDGRISISASIFFLSVVAAAGCCFILSSSSPCEYSSKSAFFADAKEYEVKSSPFRSLIDTTSNENIFKSSPLPTYTYRYNYTPSSRSRISKSSIPWWWEGIGDNNDDDRHGADPTEEDMPNLPASFYCDDIASTGEFGDTLSSGVDPSTFMYNYHVLLDVDGDSNSGGRLMEKEVIPRLEFAMINFLVQNMFLSGICPVLSETNSVTISVAQTYDYGAEDQSKIEVEIGADIEDGDNKENGSRLAIGGGGIRRSVQSDSSNEAEMIGISSAPEDRISEDGSCLIDTSVGGTCIPVEGRMSLYMTSDDSSSENQKILTQGITNALKDGMENDLFVDAHESITKVIYVEQVENKSPVIEDDGIEEEEDIVNVVTGDRGGIGSLLILGSVLSLMSIGVMVLGYREVKRRREEERKKLTAIVDTMEFDKSNSGMITAQNSGSAMGDEDFKEVLDADVDGEWHDNVLPVPLGASTIHSA